MYNVYHLTKAFFPEEEIAQQVDEKQEPLVKLTVDGGSSFCVREDEAREQAEEDAALKKNVTRLFYRKLSQMTGNSLAWGMLTGVRPTKLFMQALEEGEAEAKILEDMEESYCISEKKARLGLSIAKRERQLLDRLDCEKGFSLYVGIPFCPSICSYCSFSSSPIALWQDRTEDYLDALCREIRAIAGGTKGRRLNTIYIGGGTPTTLTEGQLTRLLHTISQSFSMEYLTEYTVEAGRPDSITREKLLSIRKFPVTRISINPQTMQQKTLDLVGRKHTPQDVCRIFYLAREIGFDNINMDLIAGLPKEGLA